MASATVRLGNFVLVCGGEQLSNGNSDMTAGEKERLFRDLGYIKAKIEDLLIAQREHRGMCSADMGQLWKLARKNERNVTAIKAVSRKSGAGAGGLVGGALIAVWEIIKSVWR